MMIIFLLRRAVTIALCAGSFWVGMKTNAIINPGGIPVGDTLCEVVK